jgi:hypothetical protein
MKANQIILELTKYPQDAPLWLYDTDLLGITPAAIKDLSRFIYNPNKYYITDTSYEKQQSVSEAINILKQLGNNEILALEVVEKKIKKFEIIDDNEIDDKLGVVCICSSD